MMAGIISLNMLVVALVFHDGRAMVRLTPGDMTATPEGGDSLTDQPWKMMVRSSAGELCIRADASNICIRPNTRQAPAESPAKMMEDGATG